MNTIVKYPRVGCGALIVNDKREVLLLKRSNTRNQIGYWSQPGGAVEFGENLKIAIKREVKEETGLNIKLLKYLCYTEQIFRKENEHWVAISYLAEVIGGQLQNLEPHKHSNIKWFRIDKLPSKLSATTRDSARAFLKTGF